MPNFDTLVVGGGGAKGIAAIGALYYIYERGWLKNIKTYSGCSIGSIICALLAVGYSPLEIFAKISEFTHVPQLNFVELFTRFGLVDIKKATSFVEELLEVKASRDVTFSELKDFYDKELYIVATKYSTKEPVYFSYKNFPNMKVIDAINMSCNIPLVFTSYEYEGDIYFDGGLCDNLPIFPITDSKKISEGYSNVLVLMNNFESITEGEADSIEDGVGVEKDSKTEFLNFIANVVSIPVTTNSNKSINILRDFDTLLKIRTNVSTFAFSLDEKKKLDVFQQGYNCALEFFGK
jgi:predicted acylesterase/phospholipase RssA